MHDMFPRPGRAMTKKTMNNQKISSIFSFLFILSVLDVAKFLEFTNWKRFGFFWSEMWKNLFESSSGYNTMTTKDGNESKKIKCWYAFCNHEWVVYKKWMNANASFGVSGYWLICGRGMERAELRRAGRRAGGHENPHRKARSGSWNRNPNRVQNVIGTDCRRIRCCPYQALDQPRSR